MRNENIAVNPAVETGPLTRRRFMGVAAMLAPGLCAMGPEGTALPEATTKQPNLDEHNLTEEMKKEKIRRAMLAGPSVVTAEATVAEMDHQGNLTVLRPGANEWVCIPGDQNVVGRPDMALDPMGMVWFKDVLARKPKPTNASPGLIYMLNGATQRSFTDPFDTTSPPGLSTVMRDAGTMVMFAGTPYAHLHICGSPWEGNEYHSGDRGVWTMRYQRP